MINRAKEISKEPNTFFTNQLDNEDVIKGFVPLGEEILDQINGSIDAGSNYNVVKTTSVFIAGMREDSADNNLIYQVLEMN